MTKAACQALGGCGPTVAARTALAAHRRYTIRVSGTVSAWNFWADTPCGKPERRPQFPTSKTTTPTGDDAVFQFASHLPNGADCPQLPAKTSSFQINLGDGWFHPTAAGNPSRPSRDISHQQH